MSSRTHFRRTQAFTLIELLTVIAIIGVLAAILIPTISSAQASAKASQCSANLRQIGVATGLYAADKKQMLPRQTADFVNDLWPFVSGSDATLPSLAGTPPPDLAGTVFECPLVYDDANPTNSYGINAMLVGTPAARLTDLTTPANTILYADASASATLDGTNLNPRHKNRVNIAYADGHVASSERDAVFPAVAWSGQ